MVQKGLFWSKFMSKRDFADTEKKEHVSVSEMYCNIDIDTECRKILSQYQYLTRILQYFSVSVSILIFLSNTL